MAGWATWLETVVTPVPEILVEARGARIESTTTLAIMQTINMTQTMVATMIGLHIGTQMGCILFTMSGNPGPDLMQVVGHAAM